MTNEEYMKKVRACVSRGECSGGSDCECDGAPNTPVKLVEVFEGANRSWGHFSYCAAAVAKDERNGYTVVDRT